MKVDFLTPSTCYLLGLIIGRGHIYPHSNRVVVEFAHKNKTVEGISTCEACSGLVTKNKALHGQLACKDCGQIAASNNANMYEQILTTQNGIKNQIIPFIASGISAKFSILGNNTLTLLTIDRSRGNERAISEALRVNGRACSFFAQRYQLVC